MIKQVLSGAFILSSWIGIHAQDRIASKTVTDNNAVARLTVKDGINSQSDDKALIQGTVSDDKGTGLPGASVSVKGTQTGTTTDANCRFSLNVPANAKVLVVSYIGMTTQEVTIGNRQSLDIRLVQASNVLNDVVVIGYGTQRRQDVNGAVSSVKAEDIANIPQTSVDQLLQGRAAGLTITQNSGQPGSSTSVRIRGITSLTGSSEPLYVIDGVPVSGDANNQSTSGRSPVQNFNGNGQ